MLKPAFIDPQLEETINEQGYVIIPGFLNNEQIQHLLQVYKTHHHENTVGCWNSIYDLPVGPGKVISDEITRTVNPLLDQYFTDWKFPVAIFIVKNPGAGHESHVHRDDSMHDETQVQYRQCWVPLVDITPDNGTLYMVPGSHQLFTDERPMFAPWPHAHLRQRLESEYVPIYPKAGDLVVYFEKTLHGSFLNNTGETRPVFQGGIMHKDAVPWYTRYVPEKNVVESYEVDMDFFFEKKFADKEVDAKYPLVRTEPYNPPHVTVADVDAFYSNRQVPVG